MPRTIQEILDHADDLAKRFEDFEPTKTTNDPSPNTSSNEQDWRAHAPNDKSLKPSKPHTPKESAGPASAPSREHQHSNATATSPNPSKDPTAGYCTRTDHYQTPFTGTSTAGWYCTRLFGS
jgi:hypothetical protein